MPNRIIKESICYSESIAKLGWFDEVLFYRLIVLADDYGVFDGRPAIIKGRAFPLKDVTVAQIEASLSKLGTAGMVTLYKVGGKPYLQLEGWGAHQQIRAKRRKYPSIDDAEEHDIKCNQLISNDSNCNVESESESESESNPKREGAKLPSLSPLLENALGEWLQYKREKRQTYKPTWLATLRKTIQKNAETYGEQAVVDLITLCMASNWQGIIWERIDKTQKGGDSVWADLETF